MKTDASFCDLNELFGKIEQVVQNKLKNGFKILNQRECGGEWPFDFNDHALLTIARKCENLKHNSWLNISMHIN